MPPSISLALWSVILIQMVIQVTTKRWCFFTEWPCDPADLSDTDGYMQGLYCSLRAPLSLGPSLSLCLWLQTSQLPNWSHFQLASLGWLGVCELMWSKCCSSKSSWQRRAQCPTAEGTEGGSRCSGGWQCTLPLVSQGLGTVGPRILPLQPCFSIQNDLWCFSTGTFIVSAPACAHTGDAVTRITIWQLSLESRVYLPDISFQAKMWRESCPPEQGFSIKLISS